jgi:hypothetical protein
MSDENVVHEEKYKGYTIKIEQDTDSPNPRTDFDNAGTMVCWHNRYTLGDIQPKESPDDWLREQLSDEYSKGWLDVADLFELLKTFERKNIVMPVYSYEHGSISLSTSREYPFNDRWDSGQVGWIYISKTRAVEEWGKKLFTKTVANKAYTYLRGEVQTFDDYLNNNVYGWIVYDKDGEQMDSVWGYFPDHDGKSDYQFVLNDAKTSIDWDVKEVDKRKWEALQEQEVARVEA